MPHLDVVSTVQVRRPDLSKCDASALSKSPSSVKHNQAIKWATGWVSDHSINGLVLLGLTALCHRIGVTTQ